MTDQNKRCKGTRFQGSPCPYPVEEGSEYCDFHTILNNLPVTERNTIIHFMKRYWKELGGFFLLAEGETLLEYVNNAFGVDDLVDSLFSEVKSAAGMRASNEESFDLRYLKMLAGTKNLRGINLRGVNLRRGKLRLVDLSGANLIEADLREANLVHAELEGANLSQADLRGANLTGARLDGAHLFGTNLSDAILERACLRGIGLFEAVLVRANLCDAQLDGARMGGADLTGASMRRACLNGASLSSTLVKVDLTNAYMEGAFLYGANLLDAILEGASLYGADLRTANLTGVRLNGAILPDGSKWHSGINLNKYITPKYNLFGDPMGRGWDE